MHIFNLLLLSLLLGLQQGGAEESGRQDESGGFRIGVAVDQVFLSVNARSVEGGFVTGLDKDSFQVLEDGVSQNIINFYSEGVPVSVVLLIDVSGSTRDAQGHIRRAALGFASSLGGEDRVSIVAFNDAPRLILNWTNDLEKVELALGKIYAKGYTVLNDALYVVFDDLLKGVQGKKAIIVLTDGIDTNSMVDKGEVEELAARAETMIYVVSQLDEYWAGAIAARMQYQARSRIAPKELSDRFIIAAKRFLAGLSRRTGGKVLDTGSFRSLTDIYGQVAEELKNQYYISYVPSNVMKDGRWRSVEVRNRSGGVVVSSRPGYYAPLTLQPAGGNAAPPPPTP